MEEAQQDGGGRIEMTGVSDSVCRDPLVVMVLSVAFVGSVFALHIIVRTVHSTLAEYETRLY